MAEWTIALVLKTSIPRGIVGSNPTSSSRYTKEEMCRRERIEDKKQNLFLIKSSIL
jgi:hypothetical protein